MAGGADGNGVVASPGEASTCVDDGGFFALGLHLLLIADTEGVILRLNPAWSQILGYPPDALLGTSFFDLIHPADLEATRAEAASLAAGRETLYFENRYRHHDGSYRYLAWSAVVPPGSGHIHAIAHDITARKVQEALADAHVRRSHALLQLPHLGGAGGETAFLQRALELAEGLTDSRISFVHFVNDDGQTLELVAWSKRTLDDYCNAAFDTHYPVSEAGVWADALRRGAPVIINDYGQYPGKHGLPQGHAALGRLISLPVLEQGQVRMLVGVGNKPEDYTELDVETLQLLANEAWRIVQRQRALTRLAASEARYRELFDSMSDGVAVFEAVADGEDFLFRDLNRAGERIGRIPRDRVIGRRVSEVFPGVAEIGLIDALRRVWRGGGREVLPSTYYQDARISQWVENRVFGLPTGEVVTVYTDLTESRRAEESLRLAKRVLDNTAEGLLITDAQARIVEVNPAFETITGYTAADVLGCTPSILKSGRHEEDFYRDMWRRLSEAGHWQGEIWNRRKDGQLFPEWLTIDVVRNDNDRVTHYVGLFTDISPVKEAQRRIDYLAHHDALTGLPNRVLMHQRLEQLLASADGRLMALFFIDLDRFKLINDSLGHPVGDGVLVALAERMTRWTGAADVLARLGGDEFVLFLAEPGSVERVAAAAADLLADLRRPVQVSGHELVLSASIGIGLYPSDASDADALIQRADRAMYEAKEQGRNNFQFFTRSLIDGAIERLTLEHALRGVVERDELMLLYQPQVDLRTGLLVGAEALVRWRHPKLGLIPPVRFIPLAEDIGAIEAIGRWVLETALGQLVEWDQAGLYMPRIAVNLSMRQIERRDLVAQVSEALHRTGVGPKRLELEVTESILMRDVEGAKAALGALKALGIGIAVDDFGTGYSSLASLRLLPLDRLKIDRAFVADIGDDAGDEAIVRTVIALARSLGLETVAEGVECETQLRFLREEGVDLAQGFLFGKPMSATALRENALPQNQGRGGTAHGRPGTRFAG